ncbi:MAG: HDOD domain-containing protein [Candidatus Latescibacteria bacterium]|nr:HDOD domain-containing protein [Candidatus Latescibacterota bacterium]
MLRPPATETQAANPIVIIADKIERKPHLAAFLQTLRQENLTLSGDEAIKYAVCKNSPEIALALRKYRYSVKLIMIGPGLQGNAWTLARMLCKRVRVLLVLEPAALANPLYAKIRNSLEALGIITAMSQNATEAFFKPLIREHVLSGLSADNDLVGMTPEERAETIEKRLEAVNKFPSLPETQQRVAALDDMDNPKKWEEAINPDVLTRTVILRILNSAYYGFKSRITTIDKAVQLASARTVREIVLACQIRQLFEKTDEKSIDAFWRHSLAVGFFAKLFTLPADPAQQSTPQRVEFNRYRFDEEQTKLLQEARLWEKLALEPKEDPFTCGMLHDIGIITMILCLEESMQLIVALIAAEVKEAQDESKLWAHALPDLEHMLMGDIDHQLIGYRLAKKWEMDDKTCQVIGGHHSVQARDPNLSKAVALADLAAYSLFPYPATDTQDPLCRIFARVAEIAKKKPGKTQQDSVRNAFYSMEVFAELGDVLKRLEAPTWLGEIIDFKDFFFLCYMVAPKMRATTVGFLQQTAVG